MSSDVNKKNQTIFRISTDPHFNTNLAEILVFVNGSKIKALLDLGATRSVINSNASLLKDFEISETNTMLHAQMVTS